MPDGQPVARHTLRTGVAVMHVIDLGGIVTGLEVPDHKGTSADVILGFPTLDQYLADTVYHGAVAGRCCNRIAGGSFVLDGHRYQLARNDGNNHLHGGPGGFHRLLWKSSAFVRGESCGVVLRRVSPDGEEGYPGELDVEITYTLSPPATWTVEFRGKTNQPTHVNLTQHAYFNLGGHDAGSYGDHLLQLFADHVLPKYEDGIPTGEIHSVEGTVYDFREPRAMRLPATPGPWMYKSGYDHSWVLRGEAGVLRDAAVVRHPPSGRTLSVRTTQPGIHFYGGCHNATSPAMGKHGMPYGAYSGFALETQHHPDTPNRPEFPSTMLRPGEAFYHKTEFIFGVEDDA